MAKAPVKKPSAVKKSAPAKGKNFGAGYSESDEGPMKGKEIKGKVAPRGKK